MNKVKIILLTTLIYLNAFAQETLEFKKLVNLTSILDVSSLELMNPTDIHIENKSVFIIDGWNSTKFYELKLDEKFKLTNVVETNMKKCRTPVSFCFTSKDEILFLDYLTQRLVKYNFNDKSSKRVLCKVKNFGHYVRKNKDKYYIFDSVNNDTCISQYSDEFVFENKICKLNKDDFKTNFMSANNGFFLTDNQIIIRHPLSKKIVSFDYSGSKLWEVIIDSKSEAEELGSLFLLKEKYILIQDNTNLFLYSLAGVLKVKIENVDAYIIGSNNDILLGFDNSEYDDIQRIKVFQLNKLLPL